MKTRNRNFRISIWIFGLLLLILDTETAKSSTYEGIELCLRVIIPSLFPFFFITSYLNTALLGISVPGLNRIMEWLHFPAGGDSLLLLGLIGGYPVGAQLIADACEKGYIKKETGNILLGYCNNAGPAFIFGVTGMLFSSLWITVALWIIHIGSALLTGRLLPRPKEKAIVPMIHQDLSLTDTLKKSMYICSTVCGWILVCKIITGYLNKWLSDALPVSLTTLLSGFLELSNGCILLDAFPSESTRFLLSSLFLAFGGFCVMLQTASVTKELGLGLYIPGKMIQTALSTLTAAFVAYIAFGTVPQYFLISLFICIPIILIAKRYAENKYGKYKENAV